MPRHIVRLVILMVVFAVVAYGAKRFFTANSFYEYGHYRGNSVAEIASDKPKYKGTAYCESCHAQQFAEWSKSIHNSADVGRVVKCEVCHGPAGGRDDRGMFVNSATGPDHPKNLKLVVPTDTRKLCTLCHEKMPGRPAQQPQIVVADHAGEQQCTVCHNPHSPKLGLAAAAPGEPRGNAALGKTKAAACTGCHGAAGVSVNLPGPTLAGQKAAYFVDALKAYGTGARNDPMMSPSAQGVSNEDSENLAAYFAGLKCESSLNAGVGKSSDSVEVHRLPWRQRDEQQSCMAESCRPIQGLSRRCAESLQGWHPQERHDGRGRQGFERRGNRKRRGLLRQGELQVR